MKIGPKYKIARRLGASVFEKTQGAKFALSQQKRTKNPRISRSGYGLQLLEKQRARFTYILTEKQFSKYVNQAIEKGGNNTAEILFSLLETRLDNVVLKSGLASTRLAARQMVSHGHITLNGQRVDIPSISVKEGDVVGIRENSKDKPLFNDFDERFKDVTVPDWLKTDPVKKEVKILNIPKYSPDVIGINLPLVIQFYKR